MADLSAQFEAASERLMRLWEEVRRRPSEHPGLAVESRQVLSDLHDLRSCVSDHSPVAKPLDDALQAITDLGGHGLSGGRKVERLVERAGDSLQRARRLYQVKTGLETVDHLRGEANDAVWDGDLQRASRVIRLMIGLLQGLSPEVRGMAEKEQAHDR